MPDFCNWHIRDPAAKIDGWSITLVVVGFLPWLRTVFESITFPGGGQVKYRELKHNVERQEYEIQALRFVVAHFLPDDDVRVLQRFAGSDPVEMTYDEQLGLAIKKATRPWIPRARSRELDVRLQQGPQGLQADIQAVRAGS